MEVEYQGQAHQDELVLKLLKFKRNGYFLEIGSNHPKNINNTFVLDKQFGWKGLMVELETDWEQLYKTERTCHYLIQDATRIDYLDFFHKNKYPLRMDYLQIDLDVSNRSTFNVLELLDETVFKYYTFKVITFEHDIYCGNFFDTREKSREIFEKNGYIMIFGDVKNGGNPYEDWYVHCSYPDKEYIKNVKSDVSMEWTDIMKILDKHLILNEYDQYRIKNNYIG